MTDEISSTPAAPEPDRDDPAPLTAEPAPGEWFALTASAALGIAGLAIGVLALLGVSAATGFAQLFGLSTRPSSFRDTVLIQAGTNAGLAVVGLLVSVAGSGRARRAQERVPGVLANAGIVVCGVALVVEVAVIVAGFAHNPVG